MTAEERKNDYELRQLARERNKGKGSREWVVYLNKLNHLQLFLSKNEPDLLFVTETWLTCKIKNSEVSSHLPYDVVRLDRNDKRGGGVCCVIKNTLTSRIVRHDIRSKADVLCVDILPHYGYSPFRFVIVYRPPDSLISDDENLIELLATFISTERETVILAISTYQ
ncbi:hypothetical protein COOONC_14681 [Cooperia oncophora]